MTMDGPLLSWDVASETRTLALERGHAPYRVGRGERCAIRLDDPQVSRYHAEIVFDDSYGWKIADLDSKNGTHVDGRRLQRARPLAGEQRIRCGHTVIVFVDPTSAPISSAVVTATDDECPYLTPEAEALLKLLCRPFRDVADVRSSAIRGTTNDQLADELFLSFDGVRGRLKDLYERFAIEDDVPGHRKRRELIAQAFDRGAVTRDAL